MRYCLILFTTRCCFRQIKICLIELWTEEESFRSIEKKLDVNPGDLNYRVDSISWFTLPQRKFYLQTMYTQEHMEVIGDEVQISIY